MAGEDSRPLVYVMCGAHLVECIAILCYLVQGVPLNLEGVIVSPVLQWVYGTFSLITIVAIICAGVGALYHIEGHLTMYSYVLVVSVFIDIFFFVVFLIYGRTCKTSHHDANHLLATLSCGVSDGLTLLCLTVLIVFKLLALFLVNKCKKDVRTMYNEKLIPYIQKALENGSPAEENAPQPFWRSMPQTVRSFLPGTQFNNFMPNSQAFDSQRFATMPPSTQPFQTAPYMGVPDYGYGTSRKLA
mmetsp:Transcript_110556/g.174174  ORF Transcript_110556/g.174174 Transcript_110556/m.174174 type:complete len:244 (+) Transcript_110556:65-796(+)